MNRGLLSGAGLLVAGGIGAVYAVSDAIGVFSVQAIRTSTAESIALLFLCSVYVAFLGLGKLLEDSVVAGNGVPAIVLGCIALVYTVVVIGEPLSTTDSPHTYRYPPIYLTALGVLATCVGLAELYGITVTDYVRPDRER